MNTVSIKSISTLESYKNTANVTDAEVPRKVNGRIQYNQDGSPVMVKAVERKDGKVVYTDNIRVTFLLNEDLETSSIAINPSTELLTKSMIRKMNDECDKIGRTLKFKDGCDYKMKGDSLTIMNPVADDDGVERQYFQVTFTPPFKRFVSKLAW